MEDFPLKVIPANEWPTCWYCIFRESDFGVCVRHAPRPVAYDESRPDEMIDFASWPRANMVCGDGLFLVGNPPYLRFVSYVDFLQELVQRENTRAKGAKSSVRSIALSRDESSTLEERAIHLFREAGKSAVYEDVMRYIARVLGIPPRQARKLYWNFIFTGKIQHPYPHRRGNKIKG